MLKKLNKGYSLIQLIIVIGIIGILAVMAFTNSGLFREQLEFQIAYQNVSGMIKDARNLALSGQSYPDYTDHDDDGLNHFNNDEILPFGYIITMDTSVSPITVSLYADLFAEVPGELNIDATDTYQDPLIKQSELPDTIAIEHLGELKSGDTVYTNDPILLEYLTPNAAFSIIGHSNTSIQFDVQQINGGTTPKRQKYIYLNFFNGLPEVLDDEFITPDLT